MRDYQELKWLYEQSEMRPLLICRQSYICLLSLFYAYFENKHISKKADIFEKKSLVSIIYFMDINRKLYHDKLYALEDIFYYGAFRGYDYSVMEGLENKGYTRKFPLRIPNEDDAIIAFNLVKELYEVILLTTTLGRKISNVDNSSDLQGMNLFDN